VQVTAKTSKAAAERLWQTLMPIASARSSMKNASMRSSEAS